MISREYSINTQPDSYFEKIRTGPSDKILIPRWVVYFQAALLGISAVTFFIFGLMVGTLNPTTPRPASATEQNVSGMVSVVMRGNRVADAGAVILLLPVNPIAVTRQSPDTIRPDRFEPLENPTIDYIHSQGGAVVRANADGRFELFAKPNKYFLVVISNSIAAESDQKLSRQQVAGLSQYFLPVENLIRAQAFYWEEIDLASNPVLRNEIVFE